MCSSTNTMETHLVSPHHAHYLLFASSAHQTDRLNLWRNLRRASPAGPWFHTENTRTRAHQAGPKGARLGKAFPRGAAICMCLLPSALSLVAAQGHHCGWAWGTAQHSGSAGHEQTHQQTVPWPAMVSAGGNPEQQQESDSSAVELLSPAHRKGRSKKLPQTHYVIL